MRLTRSPARTRRWLEDGLPPAKTDLSPLRECRPSLVTNISSSASKLATIAGLGPQIPAFLPSSWLGLEKNRARGVRKRGWGQTSEVRCCPKAPAYHTPRMVGSSSSSSGFPVQLCPTRFLATNSWERGQTSLSVLASPQHQQADLIPWVPSAPASPQLPLEMGLPDPLEHTRSPQPPQTPPSNPQRLAQPPTSQQ